MIRPSPFDLPNRDPRDRRTSFMRRVNITTIGGRPGKWIEYVLFAVVGGEQRRYYVGTMRNDRHAVAVALAHARRAVRARQIEIEGCRG